MTEIDKDKYIEKLEKENSYLKKLLEINNISFLVPKIIDKTELPNNTKIDI